MKALLKKLTNSVVVPFVYYLNTRVAARPPTATVLSELERRVSLECADYVQANMQKAVSFGTRAPLWDHALNKVDLEGLFAEFGVFRGVSINQIAGKRPKDVIYGFDSFEGLKEDWSGAYCVKGTFDLGGALPVVAANVKLIKGWFDKTIPDFLAEHPGPFAFVHVDCDTYEATETVFRLIGDRIRAGTVIVFDEYFGYRGWKIGEFKAWQEFVASLGIVYEYLGFGNSEVSIRVLSRS